MSQDGKGQRIPRDISTQKMVAEKIANCGGIIYDGPAGGDYRKCSYGHVHCRRCGGKARKYGRRDHACMDQCSLREESNS